MTSDEHHNPATHKVQPLHAGVGFQPISQRTSSFVADFIVPLHRVLPHTATGAKIHPNQKE